MINGNVNFVCPSSTMKTNVGAALLQVAPLVPPKVPIETFPSIPISSLNNLRASEEAGLFENLASNPVERRQRVDKGVACSPIT